MGIAGLALLAATCVSGIYPDLVMYDDEGECGTGAVVPWADRLWVVTYAPHCPLGSSNKLYEITPDRRQVIRPESVGGTPANRLIHRETNRLLIGPHVIDADGTVSTVPIAKMPGRLTGAARHLTDPSNKIYVATMETGLYELDLRTLEPTTLVRERTASYCRFENKLKVLPKGWVDAPLTAVPGYHAKGLASGFGRVFVANNGEDSAAARRDPFVPSGVLAWWNAPGRDWTPIRRCQFTEVTTRDGIYGNEHPETNPIWALGWDARSVILAVNERNDWRYYRLPKGSHSYDGAHGWNTEWPRIRDVGRKNLLATMHGTFWDFPADVSHAHMGGIRPVSTYLKVIGDFCTWQNQVVFGCDDLAKNEFLGKRRAKGVRQKARRSQSNLWFVEKDALGAFGPRVGHGAVWSRDAVKRGDVSDPYLFAGYDRKWLWITAGEYAAEVDEQGDGTWKPWKTFAAGGHDLWDAPKAEWIRFVARADAPDATVSLHYSSSPRPAAAKPFETPAPAGAEEAFADRATIPADVIAEDAASIVYTDDRGARWRLPRARAGVPATNGRYCREVCTERDLLNVGGLFYEMPADNAGGVAVMKPVAAHPAEIADYASWKGLMIVRRTDKPGLFAGAVDDLWAFGSPKGFGGPWRDTAVKAGEVSDPFLLNGFDYGWLTLVADRPATVSMEVEIDGQGTWLKYRTFRLSPGERLVEKLPAAFSAYWVRFTCDRDAVLTAQFGELPAGTPKIAVLDLGLGAGRCAFGCASDPAVFARALAPLGCVYRLKGDAVAAPGALSRRTADLLVVPTGSAWPAAAANALVDYLRAGGSLLTCGGYAFDSPAYFRDGVWRTRGEIPAPTRFPTALKLALGVQWGTSAPEGASVAVAAADGGVCVSSKLFNLWATAQTALKGSGLQGCTAIAFRARASGTVTKATLELDERDGSRWQVHFPVGAEWRDYAFSVTDFAYWRDCKAVNRGGEGDRVDFDKVGTIAVGCSPNEATQETAMSVTFRDFRAGVDPHLEERQLKTPQINTRTAHIRDAIHPKPTQVNAFDPSFELRQVAKVATAAELKDILPDVAREGAFSGLAAIAQLGVSGHGYDANRCAWRPILAATAADGADCGPAAAFVYHHTGMFAGSAWAIFGVDNADLFADGSAVAKLLPTVAERLLRRLALNETTTSYACYRKGEAAKLRTRIGNFGAKKVEGRVRFSLRDEHGASLATLERPFTAAPKANTSVEAEWPVGTDAPDYVAFTAELVLKDGTVYDREPGAFVVWNEQVIAKGPKLSKAGSLLAIDGRAAFRMGAQTYWGQTRPTVARSPMSFHRDFAQMRAAGLRWTRLFLPWTCEGDKRISDACVQLAQKHGLVIYHTQQYCPCMVEGKELAEQNAHFREIAERYRNVPGFAIDIRNEPTMSLPPSWESAKRMRTWLSTDRAAAREARPDALVSVGWSQGWAGGKGSKDPAWCSLDLDFTDRHYYGPPERMYRDLKDVDMRVLGKPLVLAECGAKCHPTFVKEDPWHMGDTDEQYDARFRSLVTHAFALGSSALLAWHWRDPMEGIFPCGLVHATGVPRPTAELFARMARTFGRLTLKENPPDVVIALAEEPRMSDKGRKVFLEKAYAVDAALLYWGANWSKVTVSALDGCAAKLVLDPTELPTDDAGALRTAVGERLKAAGCATTRRAEDPETLETYRVPGVGATGWVFFNGGKAPVSVERFGNRFDLGAGQTGYLQLSDAGAVEVKETF